MLLLYIYITTAILTLLAVANVEKTIFLGPSPLAIPALNPALDDLGLERLSPENGMLRTNLNASFPTTDAPGTDSWFFLENLNPGQRYEVRICWLATQPTDFTLRTYTLPQVLENRSLLSSISAYSSARLSAVPQSQSQKILTRNRRGTPQDATTSDSVLFLQIAAAADYFSVDQALMENVPSVLADIILDPFLGNVFPRSLVPTACWATIVALLAVFVARWVAGQFGRLVDSVDMRLFAGEKKEL
ncbi:hypothetical protein ASPCAL07273 [Aspergillus calidoustus]|uniref:Uncharacterized protein n=1 Tax=Aspergillus calidoustus TaxID=454130 RepID=A0A0U5G3B0_ASPCI|nr:hypothetical protein ASPCAL07273 [Aspergillus calidoustus]